MGRAWNAPPTAILALAIIEYNNFLLQNQINHECSDGPDAPIRYIRKIRVDGVVDFGDDVFDRFHGFICF